MADNSNITSLIDNLAAPQSTRRDFLRHGTDIAAAGAIFLLPGTSSAATRQRGRIVEISNGRLGGYVENEVATFKGVPYGQSTAGRNRFLPPQPLKSWAGTRDATQLGHPCPQDNPDFPVWVDPMPGSEDCLALNVWSPEQARPGSKLPVMFWIHGGAYAFGSGGAPLYDLGNLARNGNVVTVGINHRLHAFGFTDLSANGGDAFASSGSVGQLDIIAALEWVRTNVEAFGGDPGNVTVFGQSGGGAKITTLMAMPSAKGLFHRAILQSGSVFRYRTQEEAHATSQRMFSLLGIDSKNIPALQALPTETLLKCANQIMRETTGVGNPLLNYAPVIDGHNLLTEPWRTRAPAGAGQIPLLLGSTLHETIDYLGPDYRKSLPDSELAAAITKSTTVNTPDESHVAELIPFYRKAYPEMSNVEFAVRLGTDIGFWKNTIHQAELQSAAGAPVYLYHLEWTTPCFGGMWSPHAMELPFVMGHKYYGPAWDGKDSDAARAAADPGNLRFKLGDQMLAAWVNFARSGNPSLPDLIWPTYDKKTRTTMIFDRESKAVDNPRSEFRTLVRSV